MYRQFLPLHYILPLLSLSGIISYSLKTEALTRKSFRIAIFLEEIKCV